MSNKKICMLGGFSVGKTSLVGQYVDSIFSDKYLSTVGVKISKKEIVLDNATITLVLWDIEGRDVFSSVNLAYLRDSAGILVVADGMRKETLDTAVALRKAAREIAGDVPCFFVVNKADLFEQWEVTDAMLAPLSSEGARVFRTSAKTGAGFDEALRCLAQLMA